NTSDKKKIAALKGKKFVETYCSTCHLPVMADELDKKTWLNHILPAMANYVGIGVYGKKQYFLKPKAAFATPISINGWYNIITYFKNKAPDTLIIPGEEPALREKKPDAALFAVEKPHWEANLHNKATTTLVSYDSLNHVLYTSDAI